LNQLRGFLLFALGVLLWLRRFDERDFPHHAVKPRRLFLGLRFHFTCEYFTTLISASKAQSQKSFQSLMPQ